MRAGRVVPSFLVIDSSEEHISGEGVIDFADERYDLHLAADAKHPSLVALRGPIRVGGTFKDPEVQPEVGPVAARVGAAVALGAFLTPVAALLALVDPGDGKDANCAALIESARRAVAATPVASPERAPPAERTRPARSDR